MTCMQMQFLLTTLTSLCMCSLSVFSWSMALENFSWSASGIAPLNWRLSSWIIGVTNGNQVWVFCQLVAIEERLTEEMWFDYVKPEIQCRPLRFVGAANQPHPCVCMKMQQSSHSLCRSPQFIHSPSCGIAAILFSSTSTLDKIEAGSENSQAPCVF